MSQIDDSIESLLIDIDSIKLEKLVGDTLQAVDDIFPSKSESSFEASIAKFYTLKSEIQKK
jgi:hypothetical protein